jgi:hypothetical protein
MFKAVEKHKFVHYVMLNLFQHLIAKEFISKIIPLTLALSHQGRGKSPS